MTIEHHLQHWQSQVAQLLETRQCQQLLSEAEQKVTILMGDNLMDSHEQDFETPDEEA